MEVTVVTSFDDFLKLQSVWNNLVEQSQNDIVFLRHEWFKCWWIGFGKGKQLFIILVKNNEGEITGIAPLMIDYINYRGLWVKEIGFIQNDNSPRVDFILTERKEEVLDEIIKYLKQDKINWSIMSLKNIPKNSITCEILKRVLRKNKMLFGITQGLCSPFIEINSDWSTYLSSKSAKFRKGLKNKINRVKRLGEFSVKKVEDIHNARNILTEVYEISKKSWKAKCNGDIMSTKDNQIFFDELSLIGSKKEWLNIWLLNINNNRNIAYEYHLKYKNKTYALRADFDEYYRGYTPGSVLESNVIKEAFMDGVFEYDLCGDDYSYKMNWANRIREHITFEIFGNNLRSKLLYCLEYKIITLLRRWNINKLKRLVKR